MDAFVFLENANTPKGPDQRYSQTWVTAARYNSLSRLKTGVFTPEIYGNYQICAISIRVSNNVLQPTRVQIGKRKPNSMDPKDIASQVEAWHVLQNRFQLAQSAK